jgi:minimal PKS chain-length factor (CLF/KS beta)
VVITSLPDRERRSVITGLGVVAPTGVGTESWWAATQRGESAISEVTRFDASRYAVRYAGQVTGFDPSSFVEPRLMVQTDRWTQMGLAATRMALDDARLDPGRDPDATSVITASSSASNEFAQGEIQRLWSRGPRAVGAYMSIAWFYAATTGQISIKHRCKGPSSALAAEGAGGLVALAHARRTIRRGVDSVISGGMEAPVGNPMALTCQLSNPSLSRHADATAYRPFDRLATGAVPGEGGAMLVVESLEAALDRGAPQIYAEIIGWGASCDAAAPHRPPTGARELARAIAIALRDARVEPAEIDAVFADGAGTLEGDALEARALAAALGEHVANVPVTVPKSMVGRLYAGGAALDVAAAALALRDESLPPTINVEQPVDNGLDVVRSRRGCALDTVLVLARGHGGFNAAVVLRRPR